MEELRKAMYNFNQDSIFSGQKSKEVRKLHPQHKTNALPTSQKTYKLKPADQASVDLHACC